MPSLRGGQRLWTLLLYLTDLPSGEPGGGTYFPQLGWRVAPQGRAALMWVNCERPAAAAMARGAARRATDAGCDPRTQHVGEPVLMPGTVKYAVNVWVRDRPWVPEGG